MFRIRVRGPLPALLALLAASAASSACDEVVVEPVAVSTVTITPDAVILDVGGTRRLQATATDAAGNALPRPAVWRSGNPSIATVDAEGLVTAMGAGRVDISASVGSVSGSASVEVSPSPVVALDPAFVTLSARRRGFVSEAVDVAVSNVGGGTLSGISTTVQYDDDASGWLEISLAQSGAPTTMTLRGDPGELDVGTYSAQVTVSGRRVMSASTRPAACCSR
jgi:hypothetical protein